MKQLYDVIAVDMKTEKVKIIAAGKTAKNAEAIENMAIMRRGVDDEFFASVPHDSFAEGDDWNSKEVECL